MSKPLMTCLSMMLGSLAVAGCGNKGELFLPADTHLEQELDSVSGRIDEGASSIDGSQAPLPAGVDVGDDNARTRVDEADEAGQTDISDEDDEDEQVKPAKKP